MKKINPRSIAARPGALGIGCATALLAICVFFPEEILGVGTPHVVSALIIGGCFLYAALRVKR